MMRRGDDPQGFIGRVELARERAGLGRSAFSTAIDQGGAYWSVWVARHRDRGGFPAGNIMAKMSHVLGVPMEYLLGGEGSAPPPGIQTIALASLLERIGARPLTDTDSPVAATPAGTSTHGQPIGRGRRPAVLARLQCVAVAEGGMAPLLAVGDLLHVDVRRTPGPGALVLAVRAPDEALVRFLRERDGIQFLESLHGTPTPLDEQIRLIGPVVAALLTTARLLEGRG